MRKCFWAEMIDYNVTKLRTRQYIMRIPAISNVFAFMLLGQVGPAPKGPMEYSRVPDFSNVRYGAPERDVLDLWKARSDHPTPLVVYFHPGGFNHGDKSWIEWLDKPMLELCLRRGISVATANYRYVGPDNVRMPEPLYDAARAIQFLRLHAKEYNVNPKAVIPSGGSAGGVMGLWIAFHDDLADPGSADPVKRQSTRVCATGVVDAQSTLDPRVLVKVVDAKWASHPVIKALYGVPADAPDVAKAYPLFEASSAINFLSKDDPPVFLYYTHNLSAEPPKDPNEMAHSPRLGVFLKEQMDKLGLECILRTPKDYPSGGNRPFTADMVAFFENHCGK
jgi:acetyl esterase